MNSRNSLSGNAYSLLAPFDRSVQGHGDDRGSAAQEGHAFVFHPTKNVLAVNLSQHDVLGGHGRRSVRHSPTIGVKHRQRVE